LKGILLGIRKHPRKAFVYFFASFSVLWTIIEGLTHFIPTLDLRGIPTLCVVIVIGLGFAAYKIRRPLSVSFNISHTNTKLEIKFSDIFEEDGVRAIAVNEFFDSEIGLPVSERSLHGIFITKCFGGHRESFDKMITDELTQMTYETNNEVREKTENTRSEQQPSSLLTQTATCALPSVEPILLPAKQRQMSQRCGELLKVSIAKPVTVSVEPHLSFLSWAADCLVLGYPPVIFLISSFCLSLRKANTNRLRH
jgi:hypothetical protein